ncbi:MAG: hypothetical protein MGF17_14370 [Trichodesmium sp. MAG_R04]|nr:hypothetical protein [Trichodesmium sp. MAG_R04]
MLLIQVELGSNEITALPNLIRSLAVEGVVFSFDVLRTQKKLQTITRNLKPLSGCC